MITSWVLIIQITTYTGYMIDNYSSLESCTIAAQTAKNELSNWRNSSVFCIPRK